MVVEALSDATLNDEEGRVAALRRLSVLDSMPEAAFEKIVGLVRIVLKVPMSTVTLVDQDRQWFKAHRGMPGRQGDRSSSICTHTIRQRRPLMIVDTLADARFASSPAVVGAPYLRSYLGIPLRTPDGYNVGALCAMDVRRRIFTPADIAILERLASLVVDELELRQIAQRDQLTGALTRRGFLEQAEKEIVRHVRYGRPGSLVMIDIDRFKAVNDTHGHPAGDEVLRQVAGLCGLAMRPNDVLGRIGGEEFAVLLPETALADALTAAERLRAAIEAHSFVLPGGTTLRLTASFGVAEVDAAITGAEWWLAAADLPLYAAKRGGRNRCQVAAREQVPAM